ncbi:MAG TPA: papain-like cysteine protease family protein, partial [Spirochaetota bacterium]|nr:papain-like cysteine protease family protein [Spirochaetota bacterium]
NGNQQCRRGGSLDQIQWLIGRFCGSPSSIERPTDPMTLYNTLRMNRPIILQIRPHSNFNLEGMCHVIVLRGMFSQMSPLGCQAMLYVNDPASLYPQTMSYQQLLPLWVRAIVVIN